MVSVTHAKVSAIADDPASDAAGEVLPSDWNDDHVVTGVRTKLSDYTTYYINSVTGNDTTGDGSAGSPWASVMHAVRYILEFIDLGNWDLYLQLSDGTHVADPTWSRVAFFNTAMTGGGKIKLRGNEATPASCILDINGLYAIVQVDAPGINLHVSGVTLQNSAPTGGFNPGLFCNCAGSVITFDKVIFGDMGPTSPHIWAAYGKIACIDGSYTRNGDSLNHIYCEENGTVDIERSPRTETGTPHCYGSTVEVQGSGAVYWFDDAVTTGSATGKRFVIGTGGSIKTNSNDLTFLPGDVAGTGTSGTYDDYTFLTSGLIVGLDSDLTDIAAIAPSNDDVIQRKAGAWTNRTMAQVKTDLVLVKADVGLGNVDNTSDANKPVSTATQTALNLKLDSSSYTAADVLAKILTVDGSGSLLDADLLDGQSSAAYALSAQNMIAGAGLTGGGTLASDRTFTVGAGTGITVNADDVAVTTNGVSNALLRQSSGLSVVGRSANSTGNVADITGTDGQVLRVSGTALGFGTVDLTLAASVTGQLRAGCFPILTGDVTTAGGALAATIANDAVTYAKMQNVSATDKLLGRSTAGSGDVEEITCTAAGRALIDDADATAQRSTLGLVIGTNVQAYDATLLSIAALGTASDKLAYTTGIDTWAETAFTAAGRAIVDDADNTAQRTTLGLGTAAVKNTGTSGNTVPLQDGTNTWSAHQTFTDSVTSAQPISIESTNTDANAGPVFFADRNGGAGTAGDYLGAILFGGRDSANNYQSYTYFTSKILDPTNGSEDGEFAINTAVAGTVAERFNVAAGLYTHNATGGDKGVDTINAEALYEKGVALNLLQNTFTPTVTLVGGAGNTVPVYSTNTGRHQKVGRLYYCDIYLTGDGGAEGAGTGQMTIALPAASSASFPAGNFICGSAANSTTEWPVWGTIAAGASVINLSYQDVAANIAAMTGAQQNNTTRSIRLQFFYEV